MTVYISTTFLKCMDLSGMLTLVASFPIKKMSIFTSYKIFHGTVGIRLGNENHIYSPHNSKLSQKMLRCSLRCSCSDGHVLADSISGLHQEGMVER